MKPMDLMNALGDFPEEDIAKVLADEHRPMKTTVLISRTFLAGLSTAACLLLIVGLGVGVWSRQQKIEPIPPQETQTTTVSETDTTAQVTTKPQTTREQTEESTKKPETTTIPALNSDQLQQATSVAALLTTAFQMETAASAAPQTDAAEGGTRQTTPFSTSTNTALPQTSMTARIQGRITPVTEQSTRNTSATSTVIITTTQPQTDPTETNLPTNPTLPQKTETTVPYTGITNPTYEPETDPVEAQVSNPTEPTAPTDPDTKTDVFSGFHVTIEKLTDTFLRISPVPEDDDPNDFCLQYGMDGASLIKTGDPFSDRRYIRFRREEDGKEISISQELRSSFYFDYYPHEDERIYAWGDCPGFIGEGSNGWCSCIWDDGNYIMIAGCYKEDIPLLKTLHVIHE